MIDWTTHFRAYKGQWVAFADDEITVVGAGASAREALTQGLKHAPEPILFRMPDTLDTFALARAG